MMPTKCTPELIANLCQEIESGASIGAACGAVGISRRRLRVWKAKARRGLEPYRQRVRSLKRAFLTATRKAEQRVYAGKGTWQSLARWLESMEPEVWRRTERREISQTTDIRIRWPDLAAAKPEAMPRSRQALLEALGKN